MLRFKCSSKIYEYLCKDTLTYTLQIVYESMEIGIRGSVQYV